MPTRASTAPLGRPLHFFRLGFLGGFPQHEVERIALAGVDVNALAGTQVVQGLAGAAFTLGGIARRPDLDADVAELLSRTEHELRDGVQALRSLLVEIYPPNLRDAGLPNALDGLLASVRSRGITTTLDVAGDVRCSGQTEALVFRSAQEALRNVVTHADAHHVGVALQPSGSTVVLTVTDDGVGTDGDSWRHPKPGHAGLRFLADLVTRSGGRLDLSPAERGGTVFSVTVPAEVVL